MWVELLLYAGTELGAVGVWFALLALTPWSGVRDENTKKSLKQNKERGDSGTDLLGLVRGAKERVYGGSTVARL